MEQCVCVAKNLSRPKNWGWIYDVPPEGLTGCRSCLFIHNFVLVQGFFANVPCDGFKECERWTDFNIFDPKRPRMRERRFEPLSNYTDSMIHMSTVRCRFVLSLNERLHRRFAFRVFRIIPWALGGFYLSIRRYWGWTLKSDKLLEIADMHSFPFGRSRNIWLWSCHKGSSAAPRNPTYLHSSLQYFPLPWRRKKMLALTLLRGGGRSRLVGVMLADGSHWALLYVLLSLRAVGFNCKLGRWM